MLYLFQSHPWHQCDEPVERCRENIINWQLACTLQDRVNRLYEVGCHMTILKPVIVTLRPLSKLDATQPLSETS